MRTRPAFRRVLAGIGFVAALLVAHTLFRYFYTPQSEPPPVFSTTYDSATPISFRSFDSDRVEKLTGRIHAFALSPDAKTIAIATSDGVILYDVESFERIRVLSEQEDTVRAAWSPDGKKLAVGSLLRKNQEAGTPHLVVWDLSAGEPLFEPNIGSGDTSFLGALAWSPDGRYLATSDYDRGLVTFDVRTGKIVSKQAEFLMPPYDIAWSPDGSRMVATGDLGYGFRRWRIDTDEAVRLYDKRVGAFAAQLAWSPDGERIASVHADGALCLWTVSTNQCDGYIKAHFLQALSLAWSPDGTQLATGGGIIRIWDTFSGNLVRSFGLNDGSIYPQLVWLADGRLISLEMGYAEAEVTAIRFWDMNKGEIMMEFHGAEGMYGE